MSYTRASITHLKWWVPGQLLSFKTTRPANFSFKPGQFVRLGLPSEPSTQEPDLWRAYSLVNSPEDTELEFYAVIVPEGAFSPKLAHLNVGDDIYIGNNVFGFLTLERFPKGGQTLWLLSTGTGISAFISVLNDPHTWQSFKNIVLVHGVRYARELSYADQLTQLTQIHGERFSFIPLVTREAYEPYPQARITELLENNQLVQIADRSMDPAHDCVMLCGNPEMLTQSRKILSERGFQAERRGVPGNLAVEKYW